MTRTVWALVGAAVLSLVGCASPYYADRGALFGGLTGAGVGALAGNAVGDTAAGALIGAGVGAMTGAVAGDALDDMAAQNRREIEARLGRPVPAGSVTVPDVVAMTKAGVASEVIANHIRANGTAAPLSANDLIYLEQQAVDPLVVQAMQTTPAGRVTSATAPVVVEEHYYTAPYYWGPPYYGHHWRPGPPPGRVSWGVSVGRGCW